MSGLERGQRGSGQAGGTSAPRGLRGRRRLLFPVPSEVAQKNKAGRVFHDCVPLEKFFCSDMVQLKAVKWSLEHDYYTIVLSAVKAHS